MVVCEVAFGYEGCGNNSYPKNNNQVIIAITRFFKFSFFSIKFLFTNGNIQFDNANRIIQAIDK